MPTPTYSLQSVVDPLSFPIPGIYTKFSERVGYTGGDHRTPMTFRGLHGTRVSTVVNPPSLPHWWVLSANGGYFADLAPIIGSNQNTINRAYEKFRQEALGPTAAIGVTLAEWRASCGMIANRSLDMVQLFRDLRYLRLQDVANRFGRRVVATSRQNAKGVRVKNLGSLWIEWSFGWKPAMTDIYNGLMTMEKPVPHGSASGSASNSITRYTLDDVPGSHRNERDAYGKYFCKMGADIKITNPNLALASNLGLVNPVSIGLELVPFSFLADWAFDLSGWVNSFTDFLGCEVTNGYTTHFVKGYDNWDYHDIFNGQHSISKVETANVSRIIGITNPVPNFEVLANLGQSYQRMANAVSLLAILLSGRPAPRSRL